MSTANEVIRYSDDASICIVWATADDAPVRVPTQHDLDTLPVGDDLTAEDLKIVEDWLVG